MMEFLRRLSPPRETDATRAVAVLPSRFASESPLRATIGQARPNRRPDDDEDFLSLDAVPALSARAQRGPTRSADGNAASSTHASAEPLHSGVADPPAFQDRHGTNSERAGA